MSAQPFSRWAPGGLAVLLAVGAGVPACASPAPAAAATSGAEQPTPFDDLLRFVPEGLESLLCFDLRRPDTPPALRQAFQDGLLLRLFSEGPLSSERLVRGVWCAGTFRPRSQCAGDYEGVFVQEFGDTLRATQFADECMRREDIGGYPVFRAPDDIDTGLPMLFPPRGRIARVGPDEVWHALLDDHTVLTATRRHLLIAALRGEGRGGTERARSCGFAGARWEVPLVLLRYFAEDHEEDQVTPLRTAGFGVGNGPRSFRFAIRALHAEVVGGPGLVLVGRTLGADPLVVREEFAGLFYLWPRSAEAMPGGGFRLDLEHAVREATMRWELGLITAFGFNFMT